MNRLIVYICFMLIASTAVCQQANKGLPADYNKKLEKFKARYQSGERDISFIKEYIDHLESRYRLKTSSRFASLFAKHRNPDTKKLILDYVSKCPVKQLSDQAIWDLAGEYLLDDVYSNAFEYVHYWFNRYKWGKVDVRYSILSTLNRKIGSAVMAIAAPKKDRKDVYIMPEFSEEKCERLEAMLKRNSIKDAAKLKVILKINDAYRANDNNRMFDILKFAMELGIVDKDMGYIVSVVGLIADNSTDRQLLDRCMAMMNGFIARDAKVDGGGNNYYDVISKLYSKLGNASKSLEAKKKYDSIEARRMERFSGMMKSLNEKK